MSLLLLYNQGGHPAPVPPAPPVIMHLDGAAGDVARQISAILRRQTEDNAALLGKPYLN